MERFGAMICDVLWSTTERGAALIGVLAMSVALLVTGTAAAQVPTEREARATLASPKDSTSLGRTNDGGLLNPVALPKKGPGFALLSMVAPRKTNYGTRELISLIERATAAVAQRFGGSVLGVGNLGFADGKKIPWSVSHQSGRDGDLGMYAVTADGAPYEKVRKQPLAFFEFEEDLEARAQGQVVKFDVARNLALVQALVEDDEARVQYIFVAAWLKGALLAEAHRQRLPQKTLNRMAEVMHQPTDSNPHADHYHLRLFCSVEDRLHGCVNRGPPRAWVDVGDKAHAEAAAKVAAILQMGEKRHEGLVLGALERLTAMMATSEVESIVKALADGRPRVRKAALESLETIGDPKAADGIVAILPTVSDAAWAEKLFAAVPKLDGTALVGLAERVIADPGALLHPKARKRAEPAIVGSALAVLRDHGGPTNVRPIIALLSYRDAKVKKAADEALRHLTCQPLSGEKAFARFWDEHGKATEEARAESGLRARKLLNIKEVRSRVGVATLIGLLDRREAEVRVCAQRLLTALTGHESDIRLRSAARNKRHWANWWRENEATSALR